MSLSTQTVSPKAVPLPPLPSEDPFTPAQWNTLLAITDTVIPTVKPIATANAQTEVAATDNEYATAISTLKGRSSEGSEAIATQYLHERPSSIPEFREALQRLFGRSMPHDVRKKMGMLLNILEWVVIHFIPLTFRYTSQPPLSTPSFTSASCLVHCHLGASQLMKPFTHKLETLPLPKRSRRLRQLLHVHIMNLHLPSQI
jgi:hypothetical protein